MTTPESPVPTPNTADAPRARRCSECLRPETETWGRSWVEIDLAAFRRNLSRVAARLPEAGRLIVSAKKDAYGHGMLATLRAVKGDPALGGAGVATVEEALALRHAGLELPVICFSVLEGEALDEAVGHGVILTVTDLAEGRAAAAAAARVGRSARVHLKLDTGMGRTGRTPAEAAAEIAALRALPGLELTALYSHLADAWADPAGGEAQVARLDEFARAHGLDGLERHWGGSDALCLVGVRRRGTWVRSGIAVYGDHPAIAGLEPVMTFKSRVIYRRRVPAGTAISYGATFRTARPTELAMVGCGYGNGLPRALSGRAWVLIGGRRCPVLGRVCMDQAIVDVTERPETAVGEEAVLFGRQDGAVLPAAEVAEWAGTISYELFCLAGQLNPRRYLDNAECGMENAE